MADDEFHWWARKADLYRFLPTSVREEDDDFVEVVSMKVPQNLSARLAEAERLLGGALKGHRPGQPGAYQFQRGEIVDLEVALDLIRTLHGESE